MLSLSVAFGEVCADQFFCDQGIAVGNLITGIEQAVYLHDPRHAIGCLQTGLFYFLVQAFEGAQSVFGEHIIGCRPIDDIDTLVAAKLASEGIANLQRGRIVFKPDFRGHVQLKVLNQTRAGKQ